MRVNFVFKSAILVDPARLARGPLSLPINNTGSRSKDPCRGALLVVELSFNLWNYILLCFYLHLTIWRNCSPPLTIFPKQSHRLIVCSILV